MVIPHSTRGKAAIIELLEEGEQLLLAAVEKEEEEAEEEEDEDEEGEGGGGRPRQQSLDAMFDEDEGAAEASAERERERVERFLAEAKAVVMDCPAMRCDGCVELMMIWAQLHLQLQPDVEATFSLKQLAFTHPDEQLHEIQAADHEARAYLREEWAVDALTSRFEAVATSDLGELPDRLSPETAQAAVLYMVGDAEADYKRVWAIRSALRASLKDHCAQLDNIDTDHCSITTRNLLEDDPDEATRIFTEDSTQPSMSRHHHGADNSAFAATLLVALCNMQHKLMRNKKPRILLLTKIAQARDGDLVAFRTSAGEAVVRFVCDTTLIHCRPEHGGLALLDAFLHHVKGGEDVKRAITTPSDDGKPITSFFLKFHAERVALEHTRFAPDGQ